MELLNRCSAARKLNDPIALEDIRQHNGSQTASAEQEFIPNMSEDAANQFLYRDDIFPGTPEQHEIAHLRALNRLAEMANRVSDVETMINVTLDTLLEVMNLHTAWVSLLSESGFDIQASVSRPPHGFVLAAARNLPPSLEQSKRHFLTRPPRCRCQDLLCNGHFKNAVNVVECSRLHDAAEAGGENDRLKFHASVPIVSGNQTIGIMNFATEDWRLLTGSDLQLLSTAAKLLSSAFQRAHLFDLSEKHRVHVEEELLLARKVQTNLVPNKIPKIPGYRIASFWKPALEISGDFYGVFKLPNQRWGMLVADVSGKGASAALYMAMTYSLIRERVEKERSPAKLLKKINRSIYKQFSNMSFVTAFYAVLDLAKNTFTYANAGHNLPLLRKFSGEVEKLLQGGMALGVLPEIEYEDKVLHLNPGDSLVIYTDGVTDALNSQDAMYEERHLEEIFGGAPGTAELILDSLKDDLFNWVADTPQTDDITILAITRESNQESFG